MPRPRAPRAAPPPDETPDVWTDADTRLLENELRDRLEWNAWLHACKAARPDDIGPDAFPRFSRERIARGHRPPRGLPEACYPPGQARPAVAWLDQLSPAARADILAAGPIHGWRPGGIGG